MMRKYYMKPRIITIAGSLGSGKSSTAKRVAAELGFKHFSSGDLFRAIAKERGVTVEEINQEAELEHEIDLATDERLRSMTNDDGLVIDSRLAFHWMPDSFKVFLALAPEDAAERIFNHIQKEGRESQSGDSIESVLTATLSRRESEIKRYQNLYQIDVNDMSPFDLVVDTKANNLDQVVSIVLEEFKKRQD